MNYLQINPSIIDYLQKLENKPVIISIGWAKIECTYVLEKISDKWILKMFVKNIYFGYIEGYQFLNKSYDLHYSKYNSLEYMESGDFIVRLKK